MDGLKLKTPFIKRITIGCCPIDKPFSTNPNADKADLAVLRLLYPNPLSNRKVKKSKITVKVLQSGSTFL